MSKQLPLHIMRVSHHNRKGIKQQPRLTLISLLKNYSTLCISHQNSLTLHKLKQKQCIYTLPPKVSSVYINVKNAMYSCALRRCCTLREDAEQKFTNHPQHTSRAISQCKTYRIRPPNGAFRETKQHVLSRRLGHKRKSLKARRLSRTGK